jgi:arylsulfatase A-like enzyme/MFS family permease
MSSPKLSAVVFRSAVFAGLLVGIVDGVRAAVLGHVRILGWLGCVILTVGCDALAAAAGGAVLASLVGIAGWGRQTKAGVLASILGWLVAGGAVAGVAIAEVSATAARNNRFLAAGVVVLASVVAAAAACLLGPALGRLFNRLFPWRAKAELLDSRASTAGILVLAPAVAVAVAAIVFFVVWRARAPLRKDVLLAREAWAACLTALLPFLLSWVSTRLSRVRWWQAVVVAAILFGAPTAYLVRLRWAQDFQFLPWPTVVVIAGMVIVAVGFSLLLRGRTPSRTWNVVVVAGLPIFALVAVFTVSEYEPARKAASARAGFVGELLADGQRLFDFDHDGYARFLGGGDCDDSDPGRNPGATDWPDDGIDQDCDGKDATAAALRSPPFQPVPDAVPADLKILLVTIDTLRADHLGCYGYGRPTSPNLDRLAGESTLFVNGWAHAPSTRYSMPAIATGRWPSAIEWDESIWWPRIAPSQRMIAQSFKSLGYTTAAFYAYLYFNLADHRGYERGVDYYDDTCAALHMNVNGPAESVGTSARQMADKGVAFLRAHGQEKFFLWMHFYDPHLNYERHGEAPNFGDAQADLYDGEIWFTDQQFGRVLDELHALGLWDKTAIIVVGDHGESLGEHGIVAHGYHLYSPHTKVPFIVRVPGLPSQRLTTPVGHVDLAPTMVNLARGPHEPSFLGRSLVDLLAGKPAPPAPGPVFQEVSYEGNVKRRALVTATHHLIWNWTPDNTTECYDIFHDPGELKDLWGSAEGAPACPSLKEDLRSRVALLSLPAGYTEKIAFGVVPAGTPAPVPARALDARIGSALHVSGYDLSSQTVRLGDSVELVTHFDLRGPIEPGWKLFFHMDGPGGFRNLDHVPVEGAYPMDRWRPSQHIRDRLHVAFPPTTRPGTYSIYVGLFKGNQRLPVSPASASDGHDRLRLATIIVR